MDKVWLQHLVFVKYALFSTALFIRVFVDRFYDWVGCVSNYLEFGYCGLFMIFKIVKVLF